MPLLDVFSGDAFGVHELTASINAIPYEPFGLGALGLFDEKGVRTTSIDVENRSGRLTLIQTSPRGGVPDILGPRRGAIRTFKVFHFERDSKVYSDEVQNIRAFGTETELMQVQDLVTDRLTELKSMHDVTAEYHRLNAIKGILKDADGTTLLNLFTEWGVTQQTMNFAFSGTIDTRAKFVAAKRLAEAELGGEVITGWEVISSAGWFDAFIGTADVKTALQYQESSTLRKDLRDGYDWAGVHIAEYRGSVAIPDGAGGGTAAFVEDNVAYLVPKTAQKYLITRFAPADYEETVNTVGKPYYAKAVADPSGLNKYRLINTQSNLISLNLRPRAVIKLTIS